MKMSAECVPCVVSQAIKSADLVGIEEKGPLLRRVFAFLSGADFEHVTTPELFGEIFRLIKAETGCDDPYKATRAHYNEMFLSRVPAMERAADETDDPFLESVKMAIIGNIMDFGPAHNYLLADVERRVDELRRETLAVDHTADLRRDIMAAKRLLYLGDNCGEICFDKAFIRRIKALNPACRVFFAVRGAPVVNDVTEDDARAVGMDECAEVISNGDDAMGTVLTRASKAFRDVYRAADVMIAKGQANYECLSEEDGNVYFLLMAKCHVIADDVGVPVGGMVCMKNERRRSAHRERMNGANQ